MKNKPSAVKKGPAGQAQSKPGRPAIGDKPMSEAEKKARQRELAAQEGKRQVSVMLPPEAFVQLERLAAEFGSKNAGLAELLKQEYVDSVLINRG